MILMQNVRKSPSSPSLIWRESYIRRRSASLACLGDSHKSKKWYTSRRRIIKTAKSLLGLLVSWTSIPSVFAEIGTDNGSQKGSFNTSGPYQPVKLPKLEHCCTDCFPSCVGDRCLIKIQAVYPKAINETLIPNSYPLAIISGGFLVKGEDYESYAERLASWGYVAILYDKVETITESLDDVVSSRFVREIIDWTQTDPLLQKISNNDSVYLIGHSRGGKVSVLTALIDPRVKALCLIDPVDNTIYAPVGPGYPSAVEGLKRLKEVHIPMLIIGSELGSDCAPIDANYKNFYNAASGPVMEVMIQDTGHFQFLDNQSTLAKAICLQGRLDDELVRETTQSLMISWGEATIKDSKHQDYNRPVLASSAASKNLKVDVNERTEQRIPLREIEIPNNGRNVVMRRKNFELFPPTL